MAGFDDLKGPFPPKLFFDSMNQTAAKCWLLMDVSTLSTSSVGTGDSCVEFTGKEIQSSSGKDGPDPCDKVQTHKAGKEWC